MTTQTVPPVAVRAPTARPGGFRVVVGGIISAVALAFLAGGGLALWKDVLGRDASGLLSTGSIRLATDTSAIVGELRGDGPGWLYGSTLLGNGRVRATSETGGAIFVGIARDADLAGYLRGAGYANIKNFATSERTTHVGPAPADPPASASIWAASADGPGEQTLHWRPRSGDWSVVLMNADARPGVTVRGDLSAELPPLPWVGAALLVVGVAAGWAGVRLLRQTGV